MISKELETLLLTFLLLMPPFKKKGVKLQMPLFPL